MWVRWKSWIGNLHNLWVFLEMLGNSKGVGSSSLSSEMKSFGSLKSNEGIEWSDHGSHGFDVEIKFIEEFKTVEAEGSGNDVRMSTDVLGNGMHNDISTEGKWVLEHW
jgi:hypothetical protein